ncbi:hypothetical protein [Marinoscillum furvescens]|uniref:Uncharacterized protein n=1 Tax=Marinoscillum furvescens DSM 4134 TaxID=1122208 RepID=A0A3D9LJ18_MARFU|nr:hypothetical protein [Marinoscillum furvescens]REE05865.1 hypothetical protein C7460_101384 [Marinoscillum furvescens DSM 4134]
MMKNFVLLVCIVSSLMGCEMSESSKLKRLQAKIDSLESMTLIPKPTKKMQESFALAEKALDDRRVNINLGSRIELDEVKNDTAAFLDFRRRIKSCLNSEGVILSSSYSFGLAEIQELLKDINKMNQSLGRMSDPITGIRIHMGMDSIEISGTDFPYVDVFLTPVTKSGLSVFRDDMIQYFDLPSSSTTTASASSSGSLNSSNPCPNLCP